MNDEFYIKRCFQLALKGRGFVAPNPLVGAVVVKNGRIIGEGFHSKYGTAHAEVNAIDSSIESVEGATLYVNLEPCCHTDKQTPPCTKFIKRHGIAKVVISNLDPNPKVAGKGKIYLESKGIEVEVGILADEGEKLNEVFFTNMKKGKPFVHVKLAQSLDGKISTLSGDSKWITDTDARAYAHQLRLQYDAVIIGRHTLNKDNPSLTVRLIESGNKVPFRIVVGNINEMNIKSHLFNDDFYEKTIVFTTQENKTKLSKIEIHPFIDFKNLLEKLKELGICSVLVEGGGQVINSFLKESLYDKLSIFVAPFFIGQGQGYYFEENDKITDSIKINNPVVRKINNQVVYEGYSSVHRYS